MDTEYKEGRFSKNMATINYWMSQQNFPRYDQLMWETINKETVLYFQKDKIVATVDWYNIMKNNELYHIPMFYFKGEYEYFNHNQLGFWILKQFEIELENTPRKVGTGV